MPPVSSRRRRPRIELRVQVLGFLFLCGIGAVVTKLWWVQVARGPAFSISMGSHSNVRVRLPSVRGEIRDRNGVVLVQNRASYEVDFYLQTMVDANTKRLKDLGQKPPKISYLGRKNGMPHQVEEDNIVDVVNTAVMPKLQELGLARDYNSESLQN
ncbi:MAG TPA: hypothetical protein VG733_00180, partial [Chthoniobacteraceae bacterium]|nr:hypothetical protein [Chthoniobacteraceae bacterium]